MDDEKILCVPKNDPLWNHIRSLEDVPPHLLREIEHFFAIYKDLEHKEVTIEGMAGQGSGSGADSGNPGPVQRRRLKKTGPQEVPV